MVLLFALVSPAHALRVVCNGFDVTDTVPMTGAENVPVDARPAVTFAPGCSGATDWSAVLARTEDSVGIAFATGLQDELDLSRLLEVFPEADLDPTTGYTLTLSSFEGEAITAGFTTGTGRVAGLDGAPTVTVERTTSDRANGALTVDLLVTPAADPDGLSILQVKDGALNRGVQSFVVPPTGDMTFPIVWGNSDQPDEVCPQVRQLDGAGVPTEWSTEACVAVAACGCASTSPSAGLLGLALALALTIRRRA
ncbi:MAG: Ig-like domain-containing protein [Myxococcota bacterium]